MAETQKTISDWGRATFGPTTPLAVAIRASHEQAELLSAIAHGVELEVTTGELSDMQIFLCQIAELIGLDLTQAEIDSKGIRWWVTSGGVLGLGTALGLSLSRLIRALAIGEPVVNILRHMYDAQLILCELASLYGFDLSAGVDAKMEVNRARTWSKTATGRFQHDAADGDEG